MHDVHVLTRVISCRFYNWSGIGHLIIARLTGHYLDVVMSLCIILKCFSVKSKFDFISCFRAPSIHIVHMQGVTFVNSPNFVLSNAVMTQVYKCIVGETEPCQHGTYS